MICMHAVHLLLNMVIWPFTIRFSDHDFEKPKKTKTKIRITEESLKRNELRT